MNEFSITAHAKAVLEAKGIAPEAVLAVWRDPATTYPSHKHPGQHKRTGGGLCLACDDVTGRVITVFVDGVVTPLRADQKSADALAFAKRNGLV